MSIYDKNGKITAIDSSFVITDDTIYQSYRPINFRAKGDYESYQWIVGDDDRTWDTKSFSLNFSNVIGKLSVTLIATKKYDPCFPNQKLTDTVTHWFYGERSCFPLQTYCTTFPPFIFEGVWRGAYEDKPTEVFDITIQRVFFPNSNYGEIQVSNLHNTCIPKKDTPGQTRITDYIYKDFRGEIIDTYCSLKTQYIYKLYGKVDKHDNNLITIYSGYHNKPFIGRRL